MTSTAAAVVLSSLSAVPANGGGAEIVFSLSGPADVSAMIMNIAGRPVRSIAPVDGAQGLNTLLWDAKADNGLRVPSGTYLVEMTARSADGSQSRALAPLRLNR